MERGEVTTGLRLGRRRLPPLSVPGELFELYQPLIGSDAVMAWLNLRWLIHAGEDMSDIESVLRYRFGMSYPAITAALQRLIEFELLEQDADGGYIIHEPLSADGFFHRFGSGRPAVEQPALPSMGFAGEEHEPDVPPAVEPPRTGMRAAAERQAAFAVRDGAHEAQAVPSAARAADAKDLKAVIDIYHKRIGLVGPTQIEKLRFWVEEQGMEAAVVALAIEETAASAKNPRINYLEGILRNWYNSGIRTLTDLMQNEYASAVLHPRAQRDAKRREGSEGAPNASAYQSVNPELVDRWKELYPDEYE